MARSASFLFGVSLATATAMAAPAAAQVASQTIPDIVNLSQPAAPSPTKTPTPTPAVIVPPPVVVQPVPAPEPRPTPIATPRAERSTSRPVPAPRATPTPAATPRAVAVTPVPGATPAPVPTPAPIPTPVPMPSPTPAPTATAPADASPAGSGWPIWLLPAGLLVVVVLGAGVVAFRRRRGLRDEADVFAAEDRAPFDADAVPAPIAVPSPPEAPAPLPPPRVAAPKFLERGPAVAPAERAWLDLADTVVHRAGINLVTATADVAVTLTNTGAAPATGVRLAIRLTSAQPGQDEVLAAIFADPVERPAALPFDLAPGESKTIRALATMPRDSITVLSAGERPMFVPVVAINAMYDAGGAGGQTTAAFAIGVERADSAKLAPFWLDQPAKMHEAIGIRAHATTTKR